MIQPYDGVTVEVEQLNRGDMIPMCRGGHPSYNDIMVVESVEWLASCVEVYGFCIWGNDHTSCTAPFGQLVEVWSK